MDILAWLTRHEGKKYVVYDDATGKPITKGSVVQGHPTIGTGRALDVHGINEAERVDMLNHDVAAATAACVAIFGDLFSTIDPARQVALIDMAFELGQGGLSEFHDVIAAVKTGDWVTAAAEALASKWATQVAVRAKEDAALLVSCAWPA